MLSSKTKYTTPQELLDGQRFIIIAYESLSNMQAALSSGKTDGSHTGDTHGVALHVVGAATREEWVQQCRDYFNQNPNENLWIGYLKVIAE